ncbi:hypothetical protein ASD16_14230 [Cellulomonas sp. Root485]|uniref:hypothetical protein n=1 Tax=Cellulomonas sp. Root485 TaxID=1736546 RepID=UPI0006F2C3D5|nr:hypothetical protein [Cellulomonas sp. Root485]KQY21835.1 hypothetical protein ASD16_14230 [Cellulomonas sp. Root485]
MASTRTDCTTPEVPAVTHSMLPTAMPGASLELDPEGQLHCPRCRALTLDVARTDQVDGMPWVNHALVCRSCGVTSRLALVGVFGKTVLRWLDD